MNTQRAQFNPPTVAGIHNPRDGALYMAAKGFKVFPLEVNGKKPVGLWKDQATSDRDTIEQWFIAGPNLNYGVAMGDGRFALDLDKKGNKDGIHDLEMLEVVNTDLPDTLIVETPSGGHHIYLAGNAPNSVGKKDFGGTRGIDVRGAGGYVAGPGSVINGKPYKVTLDAPIAEAPEWLLTLAAKKTTEPTKRAPGVELDAPHEIANMRRYLQSLVDDGDVAVEGQRGDERTYQLFCKVIDYLSPEKAVELVSESWNPACVPPWPEDELMTKAVNAARYRQNEIGSRAAPPLEKTFAGYLERIRKGEIKANNSDPNNDIPFERNKDGWPKVTPYNARVAIQALGIECKYDQFHDRFQLGGHKVGEFVGELSDNACLVLRGLIHERFGFEPTANQMLDAAKQLALLHQFDPVRDYVDGLQWDGVKRLDTWMIDYLGAPDRQFVRQVSRLSLLAAVKRARHPGAKFDQIVVLEGPEGRNKSTAIRILAGGDENFSDQAILTESEQRQQELLRGIWFYEIADLTGIRKAEVEKVKAFASRTHDRSRPAYGRTVSNQPRRCVLFATTNDDTYLQSRTGNRRFWPVETGKIDIERLKKDRDQLFAEAAKLEAEGVSLVLPEEFWKEAGRQQAERLEQDPWEDKLINIPDDLIDSGVDPEGIGLDVERVSSSRLLEGVLNISSGKQTPQMAKRLRSVMKQLGWHGPAQMKIDGKNTRGYWRVASALQAANDDNELEETA